MRSSRAAERSCRWPAACRVGVLVVRGAWRVARERRGVRTTPPTPRCGRAVRDDDLAGGVLFVARDGDTLHRFAVGDTTARHGDADRVGEQVAHLGDVDDVRRRGQAPPRRPGRVATSRPSTAPRPTSPSASSCRTPPGCRRPDVRAIPSTTLRRCVASIAAGGDPSSSPGTQFHYSGVGFAVAGRLVERLAGTSFEQAFQDRIAKPLGMTHTRFDGTRRPHSRNPSPAASATSTVDDYARFLRMLAAGGTADGTTRAHAVVGGRDRTGPGPRPRHPRRRRGADHRHPDLRAWASGATRSPPTTPSRW